LQIHDESSCKLFIKQLTKIAFKFKFIWLLIQCHDFDWKFQILNNNNNNKKNADEDNPKQQSSTNLSELLMNHRNRNLQHPIDHHANQNKSLFDPFTTNEIINNLLIKLSFLICKFPVTITYRTIHYDDTSDPLLMATQLSPFIANCCEFGLNFSMVNHACSVYDYLNRKFLSLLSKPLFQFHCEFLQLFPTINYYLASQILSIWNIKEITKQNCQFFLIIYNNIFSNDFYIPMMFCSPMINQFISLLQALLD
jgi:hypothetical protein